jgi:hypothetical protein
MEITSVAIQSIPIHLSLLLGNVVADLVRGLSQLGIACWNTCATLIEISVSVLPHPGIVLTSAHVIYLFPIMQVEYGYWNWTRYLIR